MSRRVLAGYAGRSAAARTRPRIMRMMRLCRRRVAAVPNPGCAEAATLGFVLSRRGAETPSGRPVADPGWAEAATLCYVLSLRWGEIQAPFPNHRFTRYDSGGEIGHARRYRRTASTTRRTPGREHAAARVE